MPAVDDSEELQLRARGRYPDGEPGSEDANHENWKISGSSSRVRPQFE